MFKLLSLLVGGVLLVAAIYFHALSQAHVITKIERAWFERLFTGNRASKDNLSEEGQRHRRQSNRCAVAGFLMIGVYLLSHTIGTDG